MRRTTHRCLRAITCTLLIRDLEQNGQVKIVGAIFDDTTGVIEFRSDARAAR